MQVLPWLRFVPHSQEEWWNSVPSASSRSQLIGLILILMLQGWKRVVMWLLNGLESLDCRFLMVCSIHWQGGMLEIGAD